MNYMKLNLFIAAVFCLLQLSCSKEETPAAAPPEPDVLSNAYTGYLELNFTNQFPSFDETTRVDVTMDKKGQMTFTTGTLSYSAEDDNGQIKIKREGTLNLQPTGNYFNNNGQDYCSVKENTTVNETITTWVWDGSSWMQTANQTFNDTWNGGLSFSLIEATINGAVIEEVVPGSGSVKWSLHLVVVP
jgi:hypothetical protein